MKEYYSDNTVDINDEFDHYKNMLKLLGDGTYKVYQCRGYRCPFGVKVVDISYKSLLQHADDRSHSNARKTRDRARHKALVEYLRNLPYVPKEAAKAHGAGS
jgi:hypothetical protein